MALFSFRMPRHKADDVTNSVLLTEYSSIAAILTDDCTDQYVSKLFVCMKAGYQMLSTIVVHKVAMGRPYPAERA